jgi:transposase
MKFIGLKIKETHGFTSEKLRCLEKGQKLASDRAKIMAVRLVMEDHNALETAKILNLHRESVSMYVRKFEEGGIAGLLDRLFSTGKPCVLTDDQQDELVQLIVDSTPKQAGFGVESFWNTRIIKHVLKTKYEIEMTRQGIAKMLKRLGLSYTHSTYVLSKADKNKQEAFLEELETVKKKESTM